MNKLKVICLFFILFLIWNCRQNSSLTIKGKWQSLNGPSVVEFFDNEQIDLYNHGEPFWSQASETGALTFNIEPIKGDWFKLTVFDGENIFMIGKIEKVNKDRIRIYYFKHHGILDLADEYHRTQDYSSFYSIMEEINEELDTIYFTKE